MITLKEFMELVNYRITEGGNYGWNCYGGSAYSLDSWNGEQDGHSLTIIFDTVTQEVYEVQAHDYLHNRAYRLFNPEYKDAHQQESKARGDLANEAWDDVNYIDLDVDDDFIQKALAIVAGEDYDTRVSIPLDIPEEDLMLLFKAAHERDMTFNQFVEEALREALKDPEALKARAQHWKESELHGY